MQDIIARLIIIAFLILAAWLACLFVEDVPLERERKETRADIEELERTDRNR